MISSEKWKIILPRFIITVEYEGKTFFVFEKKGCGLRKYLMKKHNNSLNYLRDQDQISISGGTSLINS